MFADGELLADGSDLRLHGARLQYNEITDLEIYRLILT